MREVKKMSGFLSTRHNILPACAARRVKLWSLNANLFFEEPHQLTKFALSDYTDSQIFFRLIKFSY